MDFRKEKLLGVIYMTEYGYTNDGNITNLYEEISYKILVMTTCTPAIFRT